ncbi:NAD-dependent epimerase/dehydratase family protein [Yoonia vestfoldensis]|uniref:NAD-dependent epimerase/dehydratase family protein n=1 Tax=Yoonia vestfoldensis TaxID=245188 RepID=UPI00037CC907|nr:NAD-dependent epimerase/dehydratase family protein [Yoonia vestfoldensis]
MPKIVLLTGASGYIAKHIALQLLQAGYHVRGTVRDLARGDAIRAALAPHFGDTDVALAFVQVDLTRDDGWSEALAGVDVLVHTASPFPITPPDNPDDLIRPAVDGTLRALRAAQAAGVARVVLTSSTAAISGSALPPGETAYDETNWTDPADPDITAYTKSKTLAEKAAWDFVVQEAADMRLTVINPGFVVGAPLDARYGSSVGVIARLLRRKDPMLPNFGFAAVDVQDVAALHVTVIDKPDTYGQRIMAVDRFIWFTEMAQAIKAAYPARRIVTRVAPDFIVRFLARFDPAIRTIVPSLGQQDRYDNARAMATLGRGLRQVNKSVVATAGYLIDKKLV